MGWTMKMIMGNNRILIIIIFNSKIIIITMVSKIVIIIMVWKEGEEDRECVNLGINVIEKIVILSILGMRIITRITRIIIITRT